MAMVRDTDIGWCDGCVAQRHPGLPPPVSLSALSVPVPVSPSPASSSSSDDQKQADGDTDQRPPSLSLPSSPDLPPSLPSLSPVDPLPPMDSDASAFAGSLIPIAASLPADSSL